MLPFSDFKQALGEAAQNMTDAQIDELRILHDEIADVLFGVWLESKNSEKEKTEKIVISQPYC